MGAKEERTGNVVSGPAIMGEPWWLISKVDGTPFCHTRAASWFQARDDGQRWAGEAVSAELRKDDR